MRGISTPRTIPLGESLRSSIPPLVQSMTSTNMNLKNPLAVESNGSAEVLAAQALVGGSSNHKPTAMSGKYQPIIQLSHAYIIERPETTSPRSLTHQAMVLDGPPSRFSQGARRPRSSSGGLELLIALTEKDRMSAEAIYTSASSSEDDEEVMPPPLPRRPRSNSSPANMKAPQRTSARMIVPDGFLEAELAELRGARRSPPSIPEHKEWKEEDYDSAVILRDARSRLLEELSGKTGVFPHELSKYKDTYSQNGCIGIYTPQERAAIIARYQTKRTRRNWNKRVRYNCRKNLADSRVRVKGRFVKREEAVQIKAEGDMPDTSDPDAGFAPTADLPYRRLRRHTLT